MSSSSIDNESELKAILNTVIDGIITTDENGTVEAMNPAAASLFDYTSSEIIGNNIGMLIHGMGKGKKAHPNYFEHFYGKGNDENKGARKEVIGLKKNGTTFPFKLGVSKAKVANKIIFTGVIHDITEEKKIQEQLIKERTEKLAEVIEELESMNEKKEREIIKIKKAEDDVKNALTKEMELGELKSRFVSMASHEFRTPLAGIMSSISLIARYNEPEQKEKRLTHVQRIKGSVQNLTSILNDFLSLGKLQEGKISCHPKTFNIVNLSKEVIEGIEQIKKSNQHIVFEHTGDKEEVFSDPNILKNILTNLLSNAVKYSPDESNIYFNTKINTNYVNITVRDTGMGIPKEDQKHLFERFFRAKNVTNIQGTGLGLNIVKEYLELIHGIIDFDSVKNKGTEFRIQLPVKFENC